MEAMFEDYGKLGVKLMITELDVSVFPILKAFAGRISAVPPNSQRDQPLC